MNRPFSILALLATLPLAACPSGSGEATAVDIGKSDVLDTKTSDSAPDLPGDSGPGDSIADTRPGDNETPTDLAGDNGPDVDTGPDVEDSKTDSIYPEGCCKVDTDCPADSGFAWYCVGASGDAVGVCKPFPDIGRCYVDQQCPNGWICHGAGWCPCGALCDLAYEGPGICVPQSDDCVAINEGWVQEICNAANIFIFDGTSCIGTCPGCCGCEPFCDYTFDTMEACKAKCEPQCSDYIGSLKDRPFQFFVPYGGSQSCPEVIDRDRCDSDMFCPIAELGEAGSDCVLGNCVFCHSDTQCPPGKLCRMGRCVTNVPEKCGFAAECTGSGYCVQSTTSEVPCPMCICNNTFSKPCGDDMDCMVISSHPYKRCVYGHCAECKDDKDCNPDQECVTPGRCVAKGSQAHQLWGTWLIGWYGGLNHFSYIRLEPDGTMRRGHYDAVEAWADDQIVNCLPGDYDDWPVFGYWTVLDYDATDGLLLEMGFVAPCEMSDTWSGSFWVKLGPNGNSADFKSTINNTTYSAMRMPPEACLDDFSWCESPGF